LAVHPDYLFRAEILEYMHEKWFQLSDVGRHDLVAGYIRDCSFEMALDELEHMKSEGVKIQRWLHDMLIYALTKRGEFDEALSILQRRIADGDVNISTMLWNYLLDTSSVACHVREICLLGR
jgi:pentatricopeptide repeat protein